jgi:starch synthase
MKIVFAASEAAPFIKTGGLGDVAQALPKALAEYKGNQILLFLPYYASIKHNPSIDVERIAEFEMQLSWRKSYVGLMRFKSKKRKLRIYFIDNEQYFGRDGVYGYSDDGERFAFFCKAILESLVYMKESPDIFHCNDWQTALLPTLLHAFYNDKLGQAKTMFTIHNIEYQGWAHPYFLGDVLGLPDKYESTFSHNGSVNFMKGAILSSNSVTTVSRTYSEQIRYPYFAHGLSSVINSHAFKLTGIVNGIDMAENDPKFDPYLAENYDAYTFESKKAICKAELQKQCGLPIRTDIPLIGLVSRLVEHKGLDIICDAIDEMMALDVHFVILGTGDEAYENILKDAASRYPNKISLNLCFSQAMASKIYAASDIYLMPSKSEPCGLSQLLAMHYGSVPVVHETGGLKDTVIPYNFESGEGLGFTFQSFTKEDMLDALHRALDVYFNKKDAWQKAVYNGMSADFSWGKPAHEYMKLYENLINNA